MKISYKIGSMAVESYNVGDIANVKGLNIADVEVQFEVELKDLPELVGALAKLKGTSSGDKVTK